MRIRLLMVLALVAALVTSGLGGAVADASTAVSLPVLARLPWTAPGPDSVDYDSVSCPTRTRCVALGSSSPGQGPSVPVAVTLTTAGTSTRETTTRLPFPPLSSDPSGVRRVIPTAISCPTTDFCAAIAQAGTETYVNVPIALVFSGGVWTATELRPPHAGTSVSLASISCASAGVCVAVGGYLPASGLAMVGLVETLVDGSWTPRKLPNAAGGDNALTAVSCSTTNLCTAVGQAGDKLAVQRLSAGTWTPGTLPVPPGFLYGGLTGLSCAGSGLDEECVGVGEFTNKRSTRGPFAVQLTGAGATASATATTLPPVTGDALRLVGIDCAAAGHCVAVGQATYHRYTETLDNGTWTLAVLPSVTTDLAREELGSVACSSTTRCVAVGRTPGDRGAGRGLVATLSSGAWTVSARTPSGPAHASVDGVSCSDDQHCTAIGTSLATDFTSSLLSETRAGSTWTAASLGLPDDAALEPSGISCPAPGACVVTGVDLGTRGYFAATQTGSSWSVRALPLPGAVGATYGISAPSCVAVGRCVAVLSYNSGGFPSVRQVAVTLSGGTWTSTDLPVPPDTDGNRNAYPSAVSCASPTWCAFVGTYNNDTTGGALYGGVLDQGTWTVTTLTPTDTVLGTLSSISCPAVGSCLAVGRNSSNVSSAWSPLQVTLTAGRWSGGSLPIPAEARNQSLQSVSCSATDRCVAVGVQTLDGGATNPVVGTMDRGSWTTVVLADPPGGQLGELTSVSCRATACDAVGHALTADGGHKPFVVKVAAPAP